MKGAWNDHEKKYEKHWSSGTRDGYKPNSY